MKLKANMRFIGVNIPDQKKIKIALTHLYGVGQSLAYVILREANISPEKRTKELSSEEVNALKKIVESRYKIEGELRQIIRQNIERLKSTQSYRGLRHARRLPSRGQSTKRNSRTTRGNVRKTAGSGKKSAELK